MKRAALIITDADSLFVQHAWTGHVVRATRAEPSEQLLADLRTVVAPWDASADVLVAARANIRKLLPDKEAT